MKSALIQLCFLAILFCCSLAYHTVYAEAPGSVKIGVILPLSGEFTAYGDLVRKGVEEVPADGVELIFEDDRCDPKHAVTAFKKLTEVDKVSYLLGPACGSPQKVIAPMLAAKHVLAMVTNSATRELFELSKGQVFSPQYSIEAESEFIADTMNARGLKKTVVVYFDNEFSQAHEAAFRKRFSGTIVDTIRLTSVDPEQAKSAALKIRGVELDSLYLPDVTPMLMGLLTQLAKVGVTGLPVFAVYSAQMNDVLAVEGEHVEGLLYSYPTIKEKNAISYYPRLGAEMLFQAAEHCGKDTECAKKFLLEQYAFDDRYVREDTVHLKTVRNGKFEEL